MFIMIILKPMIINIINGKSIQNTITEAFSSQYSSLMPSLSNTVDFDTNSYLRDKNKPIIVKNTSALPVNQLLLLYNWFV